MKGQSTAIGVFGLVKIEKTRGRLPLILVQTLNVDPTKRPGLDKIVREIFLLLREFYFAFMTSLMRYMYFIIFVAFNFIQ